MSGIFFSLAAAFAWGASEFLGGMQSKSSRVLTVLWISSVGAPLRIVPLLACILALGGSLLASGVAEFAKLSDSEKQRMKILLPYVLRRR